VIQHPLQHMLLARSQSQPGYWLDMIDATGAIGFVSDHRFGMRPWHVVAYLVLLCAKQDGVIELKRREGSPKPPTSRPWEGMLWRAVAS